MQVRLLGPVDVTVAGTPRPVSGLRRKAVLATLALHPGHAVAVDRLVDVVWGDGPPPATALNTLQRHISYLRSVFGGRQAIVARPPGYLLDVGPEASDAEVAERLVRQARRAGEPADRITLLRSAAALWRGPALADVTALPWLAEQAGHLEQLRTTTTRALLDARLAAGEHAEALPDLHRLAQAHPLDEEIHAQLMRALYRAGRQGDALAVFRRLRQTLDEELGVEPGRALRELETAILRQDVTVDAPAPIIVQPPAPDRPVPAQLPSATAAFAGRTGELAALDALLPAADDVAARATVVISAVSGTAGVGKTALALHWAHRVAGHFPDGQLYVNLRGYDPGGPAADPGDVLRGFLEALGVAPARIPQDGDARAARYRSMLAGRRMLVMLDNARDVDQVRPLLPGSAGCLVVVTSRQPLTSLVVTDGAHPLPLELPSRDEARDLVTQRLGGRRAAAEPEAVDEIIDRCARLPLALAIAAARATVQPRLPLAALAGQLRDAAAALDTLHGGDAATDIRAVFSWSYRQLSADAARLFRLLGLHPGPDIGRQAAAALAGSPPARADRLLTELTRANLLSEQSPARFTFHDLLRAYAAERAADADPDDGRAALGRVYDHYLHTAHAAALALHPPFSRIVLAAARPGAPPVRFPARADATAWLTAESAVLLAVVPAAARSGFEAEAWRTAWAISGHLDRSGHWPDWWTVQQIALDAATRTGDVPGQGHAHRDLGRACSRLGRQDEAVRHLQSALELFRAAGDAAGEAHTRLNLGQVLERQGRHAAALEQSRQALALFERAGSPAGVAYTLNAVGWQQSLLGDQHGALISCERAVKLLRQVGDVQGEADAWDSLGHAHHRLADPHRALACYGRAETLFRQTGDRYSEASTLRKIADAHRSLGDPAAARDAGRRAVAILDALGHPDADDARTELRHPAGPAAPQPPGLTDGERAAIG